MGELGVLTAGMGSVVDICSKLIFALIAYIIGKSIVNWIVGTVAKSKAVTKLEDTVRTFLLSFLRIGLMVILVITIIGILGVPMASVVAVLASAGVTVGLALQGALSNLAGGIMLLVFKPFKVGDFIEGGGATGVVKEVTLFYTVITTVDNKRITVPNGALMNANVTNFSSEDLRRVDLTFACAKSEKPERIQEIILGAIRQVPKVLDEPEAGAPFARLTGGTNEAMEFTARAWCKNADYWDVYFDMNQKITEALGANGVQAPAVRIING